MHMLNLQVIHPLLLGIYSPPRIVAFFVLIKNVTVPRRVLSRTANSRHHVGL